MGKKASKLDKPWREIEGWGKSARDELKDEVAALRPETKLEVPAFNILLAGQIGSGKSSFVNSTNCMIKDDVYVGKAGVGEKAESLTKQFFSYPMSPVLRVYDTMGLHPHTVSMVHVDNILQAVDGHVPDGHKFATDERFHKQSPGYIENPPLADTIHCVAILVNAQTISQMKDEMIEKLKSLADGLYDKRIPFFLLLTHMDEFCEETHNDIPKIYCSTAVADLVNKISKMVHGLPENQIWPIINYTKPAVLNYDMDILILSALRLMLRACQSYLENCEYQNSKAPASGTTQAMCTQFSHEEEGEMGIKSPTELGEQEEEVMPAINKLYI